MKVELELWHLISMFISFVGCAFAGGRLLLAQFEKRLDQRFETQEKHRLEREAREEVHRRQQDETHHERFMQLDNGQRALERDLLMFKAQLPDSYVRRDDYIRGQTIIEAKLDALAAGQSELHTLVARHD